MVWLLIDQKNFEPELWNSVLYSSINSERDSSQGDSSDDGFRP